MRATDFSAFFEAVHHHPPFPWQARLAIQVIEQGRWPEVLDLPTAAGKTSVLDIALFAFACAPERFARRIVIVVDRRVIVDQGAEHAREVLEALQQARTGIVREVADALRQAWGARPDEAPLQVAVLRGGMPREDDWARRPDVPLLAVSTVDQVGSRLLFRGYGISRRMASLHAGLLGNDTLYLLDEVHLSLPFAETLLAIRDRWRTQPGNQLPAAFGERFGVVRMSATPGRALPAAGEVFGLQPADLAHPVLGPRLLARKRVRLELVHVRGDEAERRGQLARRCVEAARHALQQGAGVVALVVNRVDTARQARAQLEGVRGLQAVLITGRMRPLDRDAVLAQLRERVRCGRDRQAAAEPLVVVATQCIEAGADFDFDALVTECASLDALRQRFGRLDRRGELGETQATVLLRDDQLAQVDDPVYGPALARSWAWLQAQGAELDFGTSGVALPTGAELATLLAPACSAPLLLPAHLDSWTQTCPRPWPEPDPALWLHGPERSAPEVQLVWRADLEPAQLQGSPEPLVSLLAACPPSSLEALSLPLHAVRRWLQGLAAAELSDALVGAPDGVAKEEPQQLRLAVRWLGDESAVVGPEELEPGDTLVVPASYGGLSHGCWDPAAPLPVVDLGDRAQWLLRRRATVRLDPRTLADWGLAPDSTQHPPVVPGESDEAVDPDAEIRTWLQAADTAAEPSWLAVRTALLSGRQHPAWRRIPLPGARWALVARRAAGEVSSEDDGASFVGREVTLAAHCRDVATLVGCFARSLRLPAPLGADLELAASLHDAGKADPRFQQLLLGGSEVRLALQDVPLAKSAGGARDARAREAARQRSGYPPGERHELLSVALVQDHAVLDQAHDRELVLHLIGSHHGWCRPFAPALAAAEDREVRVCLDGRLLAGSTRHRLARLDSGVSDRFARLNDRYGWWGLAWLEALIRLADHRVSEAATMEESR